MERERGAIMEAGGAQEGGGVMGGGVVEMASVDGGGDMV